MATKFYVEHVTDGVVSGPHQTRDTAEGKAEEFRTNCPCQGVDPECRTDDMFPCGVNVAKSVDGLWSNDPDY